MAQGMDERITLDKLLQLRQRAIQCGRPEELEIEGLTLERALVFPSGTAILLAIFNELNISYMTLAGGALREGLIYGMLHLTVDEDIRSRTLRNIQRRFMVDTEQAHRVTQLASWFADRLADSWELDPLSRELLLSACELHEIGLSVDFKRAPQHAAYLVQNLAMPGFTPAQKQLLATLLLNQTNAIDLPALHQQNAVPPQLADRLCRLLRLAILFATRRRDDIVPAIAVAAEGEALTLTLPEGWLASHPLGRSWCCRRASGRATSTGRWLSSSPYALPFAFASISLMLATFACPLCIRSSAEITLRACSQTRSSCGSSSRKRLGSGRTSSPYCRRSLHRVKVSSFCARVMPT